MFGFLDFRRYLYLLVQHLKLFMLCFFTMETWNFFLLFHIKAESHLMFKLLDLNYVDLRYNVDID